jgi:hypothetical protein
VCRRSARWPGLWVGQRRLCRGYTARMETTVGNTLHTVVNAQHKIDCIH